MSKNLPPSPPRIPFARPDGETLAARVGPSLPPAMPAHIGDVVDNRYQLICELGQGGMGVVHLAEDTRLKRKVAIKFLRPQATETDLTRFRREAQLLASLSHPNVVRVFDLGEYQGRPYFVMEFLDGITLAEALAVAGGDGLPVDVAIGFGRQLCEALEAVHNQGIIHRDIKPGNVIICAGTTAVLMDFGLARTDAHSSDRAQLSGTPQYLSPEDISGRPLAGDEARRSDIYSLGITLYELIAGRPPFADEDTVKVLHHQLHDPPPPLCDIRPDVPAAFEKVIMRALEKDPGRRQFSCTELVVELSAARARVVEPGRNPAVRQLPTPGMPSVASIVPQRHDAPIERVDPTSRKSLSPSDFVDVEPTTRDAGWNAGGGQAVLPVLRVALIADPGPLRERLVNGLHAALGDCEVISLPDGSGPIHSALLALDPSCVVVDLDLLEENAVELCARLKSTEPTAGLPVILIGDEVDQSQEELLSRMGLGQVLRKPLEAGRLAARINDAMA